MPDVTFIRHGQSESNAGLPTEYPGSAPLTELGRRQARAAAGLFVEPPGLAIVSAFLRTRQTAAPLLERHPACPVETWPVQEFTYLRPAKYAGTTAKDRSADVAAYWQRLDPAYRDGEGAETFLEFLGRVDACLTRLADRPGPVVLFGHGQFLRGVLLRLLMPFLGDPTDVMLRFRAFRLGLVIPNAALFRLRLGAGSPALGGLETAHLQGLLSR